MEQDRLFYLFTKYSTHSCNEEEVKEFLEMVAIPSNAERLGLLMDNFWQRSEAVELEKSKADAILRKVFSQGPQPINRGKGRSFKWMGWAAAVLLICFSTLTYFRLSTTGTPSSTEKSSSVRTSPAGAQLITQRTGREHQRVVLPDGSVVILNANSSVTYPKVFSSTREVALRGEGYFDIKHNVNKPFTVVANKITTVVLGTAFNIKAYDGDEDIEVTVTRGKVGVQDGAETLAVLEPNQQIVFNKPANRSALKNVIARKAILWQEGDLFFDDVSMEEAISLLSQKFNTQISFANEGAKKCRFSATFLKGESLSEILKVICSFNNAQYQTSTTGITITGEGCE